MKSMVPILLFIFVTACSENSATQSLNSEDEIILNKTGLSLSSRISVPDGFERISIPNNSFSSYLRNLPLKPHGNEVSYYDGRTKRAEGVYMAVVDMEISTRDLQQCADAVMRLKGEYLYQQKEYNKIHFNFLSDSQPRYFIDYKEGDLSYPTFRKYMDYVFAFANTASLYDELMIVNSINNLKIGDVFIHKGNPYGHAVIVVDVCKNKQTGEKLFMLAQSYMPAQEIQILINPENNIISPWYYLKEGSINTPEWKFHTSDLRRFREE